MAMPSSRRAILSAAVTAPAVLAGRPARAAEWPAERPIVFIVPYPPGGGVDVMARLLTPFLQERLPGANFVIENRGGAGSQVGNEVTFAARPDGYTIGAVSVPVLVTIPMERATRYKPAEFTYIANVVDDPGGIWVPANSRFRTLAELLDAARAAPGRLSMGSTGIGSDDHLLQLAVEATVPGVSFIHVPFAGFAPVQTALLGGHIDAGCSNLSEGFAASKDGRLRLLAQGGAERWPPMREVPTLREQGVDVVGGAQRGVLAPPGLPAPIRDRLVAAFGAVLEDPRFRAEAARVDFPLRPLLGDAYRTAVLDDETRLRQLWERRPWRE